MNNLTIGWLKSVKITNGERIEAFDEVEAHKVAVNVKSKENLLVMIRENAVKEGEKIFLKEMENKSPVEKIIFITHNIKAKPKQPPKIKSSISSLLFYFFYIPQPSASYSK